MTSRTDSGAEICETANHAYSLKILYGPLCGLEMTLAPGRHFFVTASEDSAHDAPGTAASLEASALAQSPNTYLVPGSLHQGDCTPNFAIVLGAQSDRPEQVHPARQAEDNDALGHEAIIEIYAHEPSPLPRPGDRSIQRAFFVAECETFEYEGLRVAWKRHGTPWRLTHDGNVAATRNHAASAAEQPVAPLPSHALSPGADSTTLALPRHAHARTRTRWRAWGLVLFTLAAAISAIALYSNVAGAQPESASIEAAMRDAPHRTVIHQGRDGRLYLLVQSERDATWATQTLRHVGGMAMVTVRIERDEINRVEALLERQSVPFYVVRFDAIDAISLALVGDPSAVRADADRALRDAVLAAVPYVNDVRIERFSPISIVAKARAGLDALDVPYRQSQHSGVTTFELDSTMDDARLSALGNFAQAFSRDWGRQGIRFILEPPADRSPQSTFRIRTRTYFSNGRDAIEFTSPVS